MVRLLGTCCLAFVVAAPEVRGQSMVEFNRDIRPILSDNCFQCHGPDTANRKAKLRLDTEEGVLADRGGYQAVAPGSADKSEVIRRITATGKERMPPASSGHKLTSQQIAAIRTWIEQGAKWQKHWSLIAPQRPSLPAVRSPAWCRNPIDHFVLARLELAGLAPSPEADRVTLLRRVSLDLTGLPPTPAEVDAFLADKSPEAYEKAVDRLLASPRYGERMALPWLAAARYADTNGYQTDGDRIMWRWRDWVIEAYNANMPFDQFTVEQIAGDMLPNPTLEQRIATGFNRNHRGNSEGGVIPEEYAVEYVVDRVDTTFTVWLGLTMGCAKCHDHKYDPFTQKEFYQAFAYFNNVPEKGKAIKYGNSPPYIKTPTRDQQARLAVLTQRRDAANARFVALRPDLESAQAEWERFNADRLIPWSLRRGLLAQFDLDSLEGLRRDIRGIKDGTSTTLLYPENHPHLFLRFGPGKVDGAVVLDGKQFVDGGHEGKFGFFDAFTIAAWIRPDNAGAGAIVSRMVDTDRADGYQFRLQDGKLHVDLVKRWLDDAIRVETESALTPGRWHHVLFSYDGSRVAAGVQIYVDGVAQRLKVNLDDLNQSFAVDEPFRIGAGGGSRFKGAIDDVRIYDHALAPEDVGLIAEVEPIHAIARIPPAKRTPAQAHKIRSYFVEYESPEAIREAAQRWRKAAKELADFDKALPTTMVMEEMDPPRDAHILIRGEYDKKGPKVSPGLPQSLPLLPAGAPNNRLGFAKWLVDPANPLTARVTVNRYWQMLFGTGIVRSVEDFGSQGEWPTHPELLDWLATEFVRTGWDTKAILKTIVTSATYRQSSRLTKDLLQRDPDNRLLARGPRGRLAAEFVRDQALFASGLLVERSGGRSVKPYQPPGLVTELHGGNEDYKQDKGASLYRRSLYTYWKRTVPPPAMMTFDAAGRETCVVRDSRTNTPLQALNLMNDVTYVEAARVLAQRVMHEATTPKERLTLAFRLVLSRPPTAAELTVLGGSLDYQAARFRDNLNAAEKLARAGEAPRPAELDVRELAAYTTIAGMIMNLDETITKE